MPVGIIQPANQIKLTNVSLVRLKKGKKRYELACYKNKILEWRTGTETDLDNVLQVHTVFLNVSKGLTAPKEDLEKSFPKKHLDDIIQEILKKGEIQVGEKERRELLDRVEKEVIEIVSGKLVDPGTKRVYTPGMIGKALDQLSSQAGHAHTPHQPVDGKGGKKNGGGGVPADTGSVDVSSGIAALSITADDTTGDAKGKAKELPTWTGVVATRSAKSQALDAMKALIAWQPIPVMRARMRLRVTCPTSILKTAVKSTTTHSKATEDHHGHHHAEGEKVKGTVKDRILSFVEQVETQDVQNEDWEVVGFAEPGAFKSLSEFVGSETKGRGRVEVLEMAVTHED